MPTEGTGVPLKGFAEIEQLKSLDLQARNTVLVGSIDGKGMDKILSMVMAASSHLT